MTGGCVLVAPLPMYQHRGEFPICAAYAGATYLSMRHFDAGTRCVRSRRRRDVTDPSFGTFIAT